MVNAAGSCCRCVSGVVTVVVIDVIGAAVAIGRTLCWL